MNTNYIKPGWKIKIIHGENKSWPGVTVWVAPGYFYSTAGCGFVPNGREEYVYE